MTTIDDLEAMPAGVAFGRIIGNVSQFVGDVPFDTDTLPDRLPLPAKITFAPNVAYVVHEPSGDIIFQTTIVADVQRDGSFVIDLVATDNESLNPQRWAYDVTITPTGATPLRARIAVPGGTTQTLGKLIGAAQPGVAVVKVEGPAGPPPTITWDGTVMIVDGARGPDLAPVGGIVDSKKVAALVNAYDTSMSDTPLTGARTVQVPDTGATFVVDLSGDATLTLDGKQGVTVALDVATNGHALTIVDGPTLGSDGFVALAHSRDKWKGGVAAATTPTTGTGTVPSTPKPAGTVLASFDFANVADGTDLATVTAPNGRTLQVGRGTPQIVGHVLTCDDTSGVPLEMSYSATTAKQRYTAGYKLNQPDQVHNSSDIKVGLRAANWAPELRINNKGVADFLYEPSGSWEKPTITDSDALATAPMTGTVTIEADTTAGTLTYALNGSTIATSVYKSTTTDTTLKCTGFNATAERQVGTGVIGFTSLTLEVVK